MVIRGLDVHIGPIRLCKSMVIYFLVFLQKPTTALAVDSRGLYVAVGSVAGRFFVLNAKNGMHIITVQVGKSQINAMRYSPGEY